MNKLKIKKIFISVFIILFCFFVFEHVLLVAVAKNGLKHVLDLNTHMNRIMVDPFKTKVTIRGLKIFNPPQFKDKILANVPLIIMDFKTKTLFQEGAFFKKIVVKIKELNIVKNKDNVVNLSKIKALTPQKKTEKAKPFELDRYVIEIDKVKYIDYTKEEKSVKEIVLDMKEEYKNLAVADNVATIIAFKIFFNGKVGNIGVDIQKIQEKLAILAEKNKELSEELKKTSQEQIKKAKEAVKEQAGKAKEAVKEQVDKTAEDVKGKIKTVAETADKTMDAIKEKAEDIKDVIAGEKEN